MALCGAIGPEADAYHPERSLSAEEAERYHSSQVAALADEGVEMLAAFTLTDYDQHANAIRGNFVEFYALPSVPAGYGRPPCLGTDDTCNTRTNFIGLTR